MYVTASPLLPVSRDVFDDGLGRRVQVWNPTTDESCEVLQFHAALSDAPSFEFALRERVGRLDGFDHPSFAHVQGVARTAGGLGDLLLRSDLVPGVRLSQLLDAANSQCLPCDLETAVCLIRQLVVALAALHKCDADVAHGAIGPERIVITPKGQLVVVEHVLAPALEELHYPAERYWLDLGVPVPQFEAVTVLDQRLDVMQLGLVAVSLLYGRQAPLADYLHAIPDLLNLEFVVLKDGSTRPLPAALRSWLECALQIDSRFAFSSGLEAWEDLEAALARTDLTIPSTAEAFVVRCQHGAHDEDVPALAEYRESASRSLVVHRPTESFTVIDTRTLAPVPYTDAEVLPAPIAAAPLLKRRSRALIAVAVAAVVVSAAAGFWRYQSSAERRLGTFSLQTTPAHVDVSVDGKARGTTPIALKLPSGAHTIELHWRGQSRTLPIALQAGETSSHFIDLPAPASQLGRLEVHTDPEGAQVTVDELPVGQSPVRLDVSAGQHAISVQAKGRTAAQLVMIRAATTTSLLVPFPSRAVETPTFGWIAIDAPVDMQIFDRGQLIGSSQSRRLMTSAGAHDIEVVSEVLGYRRTFAVQVRPGQVASINVEFPRGSIAIASNPAAEAWVDGTRVGRTPVNDFATSLGPHEIVLRHPDFGERHYAVTVTLKEPARLNADLTKR